MTSMNKNLFAKVSRQPRSQARETALGTRLFRPAQKVIRNDEASCSCEAAR